MKHLLTALLFTSTLGAMEEEVLKEKTVQPNTIPLALQEEAKESRLFIRNFTDKPLLIKYIDNNKRLKRQVGLSAPRSRLLPDRRRCLPTGCRS